MKGLLVSFVAVLLLLGQACKIEKKKITNWKDYSQYLNAKSESKKLAEIDHEIGFWSKRFVNTPDDITSRLKIAGLLNRRFQYSGNILEIQEADSLYSLVKPILSKSGSSVFRSLAGNCITQHKFREADQLVDSAIQLGDNLSISKMQKFDVEVELGNLYEAKKILQSFKDKNSFDYLIRFAKYRDHSGDLNGAIETMESALGKIQEDENSSLYCWTVSNLGDMYGHANRYEESYHCFLNALNHDPEYFHALKGIAWLAFSHDHDIDAAKKIIYFLQKRHPVPDYKLMLAEISNFEKNFAIADQYVTQFVNEVSQKQFGDMYNKYLFYLASDHHSNIPEAMSLALREVNNRPTPESYNLLCWAYYKAGNINEAAEIARQYVENKCFEPDASYHLGIIFKSTGALDKARKYLEIARNSSYELGPFYQSKISGELENL